MKDLSKWTNCECEVEYVQMSPVHPMLCLNERFVWMSIEDSCEIMLCCTIWYLAGGYYPEIQATANLSTVLFWNIIWHTIDVIQSCDVLGIELLEVIAWIAVQEGLKKHLYGVVDGFVGSSDGSLMHITAPFCNECGNVGAHFSRHYYM